MLKKNRIKKNKVMIFVVLVLICSMGILSACGNVSGAKDNAKDSATAGNGTVSDQEADTEDKISVVCMIFPPYDWTREVIGELIDDYEVTMLLDNGVDLHSYQPTAEDVAKISDCDVFIYVGGESDGWVEDALQETQNKERQVINLLDELGDSVREEEIVEGMQSEEEHEHTEESKGDISQDAEHEEDIEASQDEEDIEEEEK